MEPSEARWRNFVRLTSGEPAWPRLVRAASLFREPGDALDVGAGGGRDTGHLLRLGWRVTAVDSSPAARAALRRLVSYGHLRVVAAAVEDFGPADYDLVNAQFVLPFVSPARFTPTVERLRDAVRPGGVLAGTFFGARDEWNVPGSQLTFSSRSEIGVLFGGWEVVELSEVEEDGHTADGTPKHWHVYHLIARRAA